MQVLVWNVHHFIVIDYNVYLIVRVLILLLFSHTLSGSVFNFQLPVTIHNILMVSYYAVYSLILCENILHILLTQPVLV